MLTLGMTGLRAARLDEIVARQLACFGRVVGMKVMPPIDQSQYGAIVVTMSTREEARRLAHALGDSHFGPIVVIRLLLINVIRQKSARGVFR